MTITTVEQLIGFLKQFPGEMPVVKGLPTINGYHNIPLVGNATFSLSIYRGHSNPEIDYVDSVVGTTAFMALVL